MSTPTTPPTSTAQQTRWARSLALRDGVAVSKALMETLPAVVGGNWQWHAETIPGGARLPWALIDAYAPVSVHAPPLGGDAWAVHHVAITLASTSVLEVATAMSLVDVQLVGRGRGGVLLGELAVDGVQVMDRVRDDQDSSGGQGGTGGGVAQWVGRYSITVQPQ